MAIHCIAIKADFGVENADIVLAVDDQRVDLQHLAVLLDEELVERVAQLDCLLDLLALHSQRLRDAQSMEIADARRGVHIERNDFLRRCRRDFLDIHPALCRGDKRNTGSFTIHQHREIQLSLNFRAIFDVDRVDLFARRAGLVGDEGFAEHFADVRDNLFNRFDNANTARTVFVALEFSFAASASVDLRLHDPDRSPQFFGCGLRLRRFRNRASFRDKRSCLAEQRLGLKFVNVHSIVSPKELLRTK